MIRELVRRSSVFGFQQSMQRFANVYYGKLVVSLVVILSIMSSTLFSLGYVIVVCLMMYASELFLSVEDARTKLVPFLKNFCLPYMIFEISVQLAFQMPIAAFDPLLEHGWALGHLPTVLGLQKYFTVMVLPDGTPVLVSEGQNSLIQLWLKALVYFFISVQIQIIKSKGFEGLSKIMRVGKLKGMALTYHFNNLKVYSYFKHQTINLKKEQMMIKVKQKCDKWKSVFERQAKHDEELLSVHRS